MLKNLLIETGINIYKLALLPRFYLFLANILPLWVRTNFHIHITIMGFREIQTFKFCELNLEVK